MSAIDHQDRALTSLVEWWFDKFGKDELDALIPTLPPEYWLAAETMHAHALGRRLQTAWDGWEARWISACNANEMTPYMLYRPVDATDANYVETKVAGLAGGYLKAHRSFNSGSVRAALKAYRRYIKTLKEVQES